MRTMFHVTPESNVDSILEQGLKPAIGRRSQELGESNPAIFLFVDVEAVENALSNWLGELFDDDQPLSLLMVDVEGLSFVEVDGVAGFEAHATLPLEPSRLTLVSRDLDDVISIKAEVAAMAPEG